MLVFLPCNNWLTSAKWSSLEFSLVSKFYSGFYIFLRVAVTMVLERMSLVQVFYFVLIGCHELSTDCLQWLINLPLSIRYMHRLGCQLVS